jgi:hypothetical protein
MKNIKNLREMVDGKVGKSRMNQIIRCPLTQEREIGLNGNYSKFDKNGARSCLVHCQRL